MNKKINKELSETISFLRFPIIILVVILHTYTTTRGLIDGNNSILYTHLSYIMSLTFGEMGVPMFFFISGILFFTNFEYSTNCYINKCKSRIKTLVIPYFIWNTFIIICYWILQNIQYTKSFFNTTNLLIDKYTITDFIRAYWDNGNWDNGNGVPILQPYWYIRNLIILCIISPVIAYIIKHLKWFPIIPLIIWVISKDLALSYSSLAFFSLGGIISIHDFNIISTLKKWHRYINSIFIFSFITTYIIHFYYPNNYEPYLHRITLILGIPFIFNIAYNIKEKIHIKETLVNSSFIIYTIHLPIMLAIRKIEYHIFKTQTEFSNVFLYIIAIIITLYICIIFYMLMNTYCKRLLKIITGR